MFLQAMMMMYARRYVQIQVNGDTFYRDKNVIDYYGKFLTESLEPFEFVEEVTIEVDEILYLVNRIQDVKLRSIIRQYIAYFEKLLLGNELVLS